jgi:uncharacterized OB-fold protein
MDLSRIWRLRLQRYKLQGTRCRNCADLRFPPVLVCCQCQSRDLGVFDFSGKGAVYSFSTVYSPLDRFEDVAPYVVALIELEEGPRVTAQLTDVSPNDVKIGMPVEMVIRRISERGNNGVIAYGYKFRPPIEF